MYCALTERWERGIAKIFDPLGRISHIPSMLKVFIQKLFRLKLSWDEILPENLSNEWTAMMSELTKVHLIAVPRYYFGIIQSKPTKIELFGFCDASSIAFAALVYAKITSCGQSSIQLVCSKTRVTPLAKHSIPRLELLSCLILARLISTVQKSFSPLFNIDIMQCWTHSLAAKYWIKGVSRYWTEMKHPQRTEKHPQRTENSSSQDYAHSTKYSKLH